jgi:LacI family transcriptional regulator
VAKRAGVSISTVSRALNQSSPVREDLRIRVLAAAEELKYTPSLLAQNLRRSQITSPMIGVIVPSLRPPFFSEAIEALQDVLIENDRIVYVCNANSDPELEMVYAAHLQSLHVDGVIFVSTWGWEDLDPIKYLLDHDIPVAVINRFVEDLPVDLIYADKTQANYLATTHLVNLGHRLIACISIQALGSVKAEEAAGYRKALSEAGIPFKDDLLVAAYPNYSGSYEPAKNLLSRAQRPTAIYARSDVMAIGAVRAALDLGLRVPQDVSIVGYGDIDVAQYVNPPLTTVRQPISELGALAASMLMDRIANKSLGQRRVVIEPRLILRGTTAPLTSEHRLESLQEKV